MLIVSDCKNRQRKSAAIDDGFTSRLYVRVCFSGALERLSMLLHLSIAIWPAVLYNTQRHYSRFSFRRTVVVCIGSEQVCPVGLVLPRTEMVSSAVPMWMTCTSRRRPSMMDMTPRTHALSSSSQHDTFDFIWNNKHTLLPAVSWFAVIDSLVLQ